MYISHKSNVLQTVHETEWQCRRLVKGLDKSEYWTWLATITTQDENDNDVVTYPSEDFTIVECTDEDVQARIVQLDDYVSRDRVYNIKYYASKRDVLDEEGEKIVDVEAYTDEDGNDVAETYVQSHFVGQDDAKDARLLAEQWTRIRTERDILLTSSDWTQGADSPLGESKKTEWATHRTLLRDLPSDQSSKTTYADITWPTEPE